jgi:hypothetical protein
MPITSNRLVGDLHKILTSSIAQMRFYKARATGFRSEIEFGKLISVRGGLNLLDGGQFLFSNIEESPENFIVYVTVTDDSEENYTELYSKLSELSVVRKLFFVKIGDINEWETTRITIKNEDNDLTDVDILEPTFSILRFESGSWIESNIDEIKQLFVQRNRNIICAWKSFDPFSYLNSYSVQELKKLYCNRFLLDISLGDVNKGMIDVDGIMKEDNNFILIETKEKDPIKDKANPNDTTKWFFGWDSRRFSWYLYLKLRLEIDTLYVIREVDNQTQRNFVRWKKISIDKFCECTSWLQERAGGGGGGTVEAPYTAFEDL